MGRQYSNLQSVTMCPTIGTFISFRTVTLIKYCLSRPGVLKDKDADGCLRDYCFEAVRTHWHFIFVHVKIKYC